MEIDLSRTTKDLPYHVSARRGIINHDHSKGVCVVGTYRESIERARIRNAHRGSCPRYVDTVTCVHNHEREVFQNKVNTTRAAQRAYSFVHPSNRLIYQSIAGENRRPFFSASRFASSEAILAMVRAGYFPNCDQPATHERSLVELDLGLLPGESLYSRLEVAYGYRMRHPRILSPRYDASIECKVCDDLPEITCYLSPRPEGRYRNRYACRCCDEGVRLPARSTDRIRFAKMVKDFNTCGEVDD